MAVTEAVRQAVKPDIESMPILNQVVFGYSPIIDRQRQMMGTRLSVFPIRPDRTLAVGELIQAVSDVWPADGAVVALSVRSEDLLTDLLNVVLASNVQVEVPHFMASNPALTSALQALAARGNVLLLSGRPTQALSPAVLACFRHSLIEIAEDRRGASDVLPAHVKRRVGFFQTGVRTVRDMEESFARGAVAVVGWPIDEVTRAMAGRRAARPDMGAIVSLINLIEEGAPLERLEQELRKAPTLAYKLMRYVSSPLFGLSVEVTSFSHAVMILGYQRMKRWLALALVTAETDPDLRPVMFAGVRRGLVMEQMADASLGESLRNDLFMCGVFSLLDRLLQEPFDQLLRKIPVQASVFAALAERKGPLAPYLRIAESLEGGSGLDIREAAQEGMLDMRDVNRALLRGLAGVQQLG